MASAGPPGSGSGPVPVPIPNLMHIFCAQKQKPKQGVGGGYVSDAILAGYCNSIHAITSSSDEINSASHKLGSGIVEAALQKGNISWVPWTTPAACLPF